MLTDQQEAAGKVVTDSCRSAEKGQPIQHFVLEAVAGSGKTRTLACIVERVMQHSDNISVLLLQFNQEACRQMRERLNPFMEKDPNRIHVHTIHSYGLWLLGDPDVDPDKLYKAWYRLRGHTFMDNETAKQEWIAVQRTVDHIRHRGVFPNFVQRPLTLEATLLEACIFERTVLDLEDAVYHCLYYGTRAKQEYTLVLVDEAQDLNDANHQFLRRCVVPRQGRTILCAVGDPGQAIYQFRGANPESLQRLTQMFCAQQLYLTCCFRCPRRIVSVASYLFPNIHAAPAADLGGVKVCKCDGWNSLEVLLDKLPKDETVLFVARTNRGILNFVRYLYGQLPSVLFGREIRWAAPSLLADLHAILEIVDPNQTVEEVMQHAQQGLDGRGPMETAKLRVLETVAEMDGESTLLSSSPFLSFVIQLLSAPPAIFTMATIHASKGAEHDHVFLDQYNLIGGPEGVQERNLLYIAITRAKKTLTFFMHGKSQYVPSALLPTNIIHMSGHLES